MIRIFRVYFSTSTVFLILTETLLLFFVFIAAMFLVSPGDLEINLLYEDGLAKIAVAAGSILLSLYFQDLYTDIRVRSRVDIVQQWVLTLGVIFLIQALLSYTLRDWVLPRLVLVAGCTILLFVMPMWRIAYTSVIYKGLGLERILYLGSSELVQNIAQRFEDKPQLGFRNIGFLDDSLAVGTPVANGTVVGSTTDLRKVVNELRPTRIVVGLAERRGALPVYELLDLRFQGMRIDEAAHLYETAFGRVAIRALRPSQLIFAAELMGPLPLNRRLQTIYSFLLGLIGIVVAAPIMLIVAALVKLTSPGPVIYKQNRVGRNNVPFTVYKFRSMVSDAEKKTGAVWASRNDPRVTPFGRFIRKTRLDELPQLFNVIRGEMAIVGPRPERPEFVQTLSEQIPFYRQRHYVKPGLTGWAQINYKYGDTFEDTVVKLEYDLYYIKNLSVGLDSYIMFNTIKTMLLTRGAH